MKKIFFTLFVLCSISMFSQQRTGISYQALILNPNGEQLPGFNNQNSPLVSTDICLEFLIIDENGVVEYSENQSVKTDKYGMVNLSIGNGDFAGGYSGGWNDIVWSEKSKKLKVNLDTSGSCTSFTEISNQDLTAVPFALFAPGQEGLDGESAYEIWLSEGNSGTVQDYLDSLKGEKGDDGLSAFEIWKDLGNTETKEDFIQDLKGEDGEDGKSAYQIWLDAGNTGTEEEFLNSLKGDSGGDGASASQSLIRTVVEAAGDNCSNGGIKIETGIDVNDDGILSDDEVNSSQTKYLCNGTDGEDGEDGENGEDGADGSGSGSNCYGFDVLGAIETTMNSSGILHDTDYGQYPNVSSGSISSNVSGTNISFSSLNTNKFVISSSSNRTRMPHFNLTIKGYDSSGVLIDLSIKIDQHYWIYSDYSDFRGAAGGGFNYLSDNYPTLTQFYYKGSEFQNEFGSRWTDRGGADGSVTYSLNVEISSNKTIDRISLEYTPVDNWTTSGAGQTTSFMVTSFINYSCSSGGSGSGNNSDNNPPDGLKVGDEWGGGIVVYIDESGNRGRIMAKEENISTVLQWSTNQTAISNLSTGYQWGTQVASDNLGRDNFQAVLDFYVSNEGSAPAFEYVRDIEIDGYDDWYIPSAWELKEASLYIRDYFSRTVTGYWSSLETENGTSAYYLDRVNDNGGTGRNSDLLTIKAYNKIQTNGKMKVIPFRSFGE